MAVPGSVKRLIGAAVVTILAILGAPAPSWAAADAPKACAPLNVVQQKAPSSAETAGPSLVIASLNMAGRPDIADHIVVWTAQRAIDVLLLQEVGHASEDGETFVAALGARLGFHSAYAPADIFGAHTQGLAILSRFPVDGVQVLPLAFHHLRFKSRCRIALGATVRTPDGPIHLMNVHLDTRINGKERLAQLAPVLDALDGIDAPQLVGGDFNTIDAHWVGTMWPLVYGERQSAELAEYLAGKGFHTPFKGTQATLKLLHLPIKLDWLYLKRLTARDWNIDTVPLSDHRGIWARMER